MLTWWPWGLWPWSGLLIGSGLCGPRRDGRFCCTLAFGVLPNLEGQVGQGALCLGFSNDIYDEQFDCEGWKLQVAWHYKTRDTQDSSDVLLEFDKSKWDLSQLKVDCVIKSRCSWESFMNVWEAGKMETYASWKVLRWFHGFLLLMKIRKRWLNSPTKPI